jgi:hypothetical protein
MKIVSGGQTGVDRAALDAGLAAGVPVRGWCPKGRLAEDGTIPPRYPLEESDTAEYEERTELNVRDSDATLIITKGNPTGGTAYTIDMAAKWERPCMVVDLADRTDIAEIVRWLEAVGVTTLNVAGPRESSMPGIHDRAYVLLAELLSTLNSA